MLQTDKILPTNLYKSHDFGNYVATLYMDPSGFEFCDHVVVKVKDKPEIIFQTRLREGRLPFKIEGWKPSRDPRSGRVPVRDEFVATDELTKWVTETTNEIKSYWSKFYAPAD